MVGCSLSAFLARASGLLHAFDSVSSKRPATAGYELVSVGDEDAVLIRQDLHKKLDLGLAAQSCNSSLKHQTSKDI